VGRVTWVIVAVGTVVVVEVRFRGYGGWFEVEAADVKVVS
jgi:hypothetical protein